MRSEKILMQAGSVSVLILSVLSVFIIIFSSSLFSYSYNLGYYERGQEKFSVYNYVPEGLAKNATADMISFLRDGDDLDQGFFSADEISHLQDVRIILMAITQYYYLSLIFFWAVLIIHYLFFRRTFMRFFFRLLLFSGLFSFIILVISSIAAVFFFSQLFQGFHILFFENNYGFDPSVSLMKALLPDEFFKAAAISILVKSLFKSILLTISGFILGRKNF